MKIRVLKKDNITPSVWSGGKTYEYCIYPSEGSYSEKRFKLRISSATIEDVPSTFTKFDGFRRYLVMLDNTLQITQNMEDKEYKQNTVFSFDSADDIISFSKGVDFNLMLHKDVKDEVVELRAFPFITQCNFVFVFALKAMDIRVNKEVLKVEEGDCILVENPKKALLDIEMGSHSIIGYLNL
ncbi:HutD family protein [Myroides phaeus]|uniref:HutD family protein n=1 Tax=Myroides phaeus TaxID=702745 RepID=UPI001303ADBA|nr:HutD family protein [Myroides phaeus]